MGKSPCGCDGGSERIIAPGTGADQHEVERLDVAVCFFESLEKSGAATAWVAKCALVQNFSIPGQCDAACAAGALYGKNRHD